VSRPPSMLQRSAASQATATSGPVPRLSPDWLTGEADRLAANKFLHPGPGYGVLLPQGRGRADPHRARGTLAAVVEQVQTVNSERKIAMASRIERATGGKLAGKSVAVLGVTFKPDTDDVRAAPSLTLIPMLQEKGASVRAYDSHARENAEELLPGVIWCGSALEAAEKADIAICDRALLT
jgi:UDPglucose 6-dehydrogenase